MDRSASLPSSSSSPSAGPAQPAESSALSRAERFVWLTARVLEQRRFAYHFLGGGAEAVETALAAYLGADGGYGHALEPDLRGPVSQPLHAVHALRVLDGIGRCGGQRVERLCRVSDGRVHARRRAARAPPLAARLSGGPLGPVGGRSAQ
ncbi:hypothetical protein JOF35_006307 [Streptomyces demainii]|uniref:Uncharacterized protein n=1 Tax=Streptomyces demainii TaxID=588122 RepID=A0ABT9L023_9ACTN|nr:hypothetical protein [Streptomyces demainii]